MWLYILLTLAGLVITLVGVLGVLGVLGSRLDEKHTSSASVQVAAAPAAVWATINDMEDFPSWIPGFTKMERLPDENGKLVWRQRMGRNSFVTNNDVFEPPDAQGRPRVLRTIKDDHGPFSGSWDHVVEPAPSGGGSVLTVTETGIIKSAIPRAIMRYVIGEDFYLKKFLSAVKKKMG